MMNSQVIKIIKANSVLGAIAGFIVLVFGGWSGAVIAWLLGCWDGDFTNSGSTHP